MTTQDQQKRRVLVNGLIPYGRIWRVGANESTKFKVSHDILVNGDTLKAGVYALYAFPDKEKWDIVFHSDTSHWGDGRDAYDPSKDALELPVTCTMKMIMSKTLE